MEEDRMLSDEILLGIINAKSGGGGGGGTDDYNDLKNQPKIEGVTLKGNKTAADLGLATAAALADKVDKVQGKSLSTNDFTDAYKTAIGDNTTALALKQNATDNNLDTEDKTIVGAINENAGDIGQLKSGLTTLDTEVNGDATVYPYADVITIEDAVPANLADCSVKIEPVQDLHGYDKPWVGGASKNKLPMDVDVIKLINTSGTWNGNVYSENGTTATVLTDNDGNVTGFKVEAPNTPSSTFIFNVCYQNTELSALENVSVTMNGCPANGSSDSYAMQFYLYNGSENVTEYGSGVTFTPSNLSSGSRIRIVVKTATPSGGLLFYPMIRLSTETDATFAPYTNICPITGHTEASVQRDGGNLWDEITEAGAIDPNTGEPIVASGFIRSVNYTKVLPNADYYVVANNHSLGLRYYDRYHNIIGYDAMSANSRSITTPNNCRYIKLVISQSSYTNDIAINSPATITTYTAYQGKTYTIALGDTVYGGTVDFDSGVMTVTHALIEFDGTESWRLYGSGSASAYAMALTKSPVSLAPDPLYCISNSLEVIGASEIYGRYDAFISTNSQNNWIAGIRTITTVEDWKTYLASNPVQLCYPIITPFTVQLTTQQIQLLKGTNTITASTGQISVTVNGVSGAIGAVQEQVNGLAEDVAEIKPVNYSTTEQKTGQKWIDGKDIYCRTFTGLSITTTSTWQDTGIDSSNMDTILGGLAIDDYKQSIVCSFGFGTNPTVILRAYMSTNVIKSVTLYYTKTA